MKITLLAQGYNPPADHSAGEKLRMLFTDARFRSFTALTAFSGRSGVFTLSLFIASAKTHLKSITIVTGVDERGTSKEALEDLRALPADTFVFYQRSASSIFHPKIYLFEGEEVSTLLIGSSNLTGRGLFSSVEASLCVETDNSKPEDRKIIADLKDYFNGIFNKNDPNLQRISTELIEQLVSEGVVPTEVEMRTAFAEMRAKETSVSESALLAQLFPERLLSKIPKEFRRSAKNTKQVQTNNTPAVIQIQPSLLLWQSGPLTERDLNIPKGNTTNPTGSMLFKKGLLEHIDQRHHFRDNVFSSLEWQADDTPRTAHIERAQASFRIVVNGIDEGEFVLRLAHNTKTDTRTYEQNNSMTSISWGEAKKVVARPELIGKSAALYRVVGDNRAFVLVIG